MSFHAYAYSAFSLNTVEFTFMKMIGSSLKMDFGRHGLKGKPKCKSCACLDSNFSNMLKIKQMYLKHINMHCDFFQKWTDNHSIPCPGLITQPSQ